MEGPFVQPAQPSPALLGLNHLLHIRRDQLRFYERLRDTHGDVVRLRLGPYRSHLLFHPDHIEELLTRKWSNFVRFKKLVQVVRQWNGDSLLLAEGDNWRERRRKVVPAFQTKRLPGYGAMTVSETTRLCDQLSSEAVAGRLSMDTDATMARLTLDIATRTLFGAAPRTNGADIERAIQILSDTAFRESTAPVSMPDWLPLHGKYRKKWAMRIMDDLVRALVHERMHRGTQGDQADLLASLIQQHEGHFEQIRNDVMSLLIAGHETSGALLSWLFACLAQNPDWLAKLRQELEVNLKGSLPVAADLKTLPVLRAVVDETLRLYPPAYTLFLRQAEQDTDLLGLQLRKGDLVQIVPFITQRDPRFFVNPDEFDPARFLTDPTWPQYAYLPFGAGPRVCIGQNFGLIESCLVVATVLQRMVPDRLAHFPSLSAKFSLRPQEGLPMTWSMI
ncbi:cytochrome P450 [Sulfitobacter mediterraneus]|uniref:cytochrome P450 n=1 Tax=Sulfitobacter mediterraneus TaxID=83219 RepID=UPI00193A56E8|nr:cytochrome P450 [Sulfitobacter mediterraneus]MBM1556841.1 cytochrome P450 [Sulfitobacter mediterraneus]MBM1569026.1 cytochrome P450 [Sulfitobacter mediterraneus]MBM1572453.1 cytochrome P450 [Sulfitobacter mediterraneus]MBM1576616.1 cytochrome P450 [Sulfitobacter mediterraneus]MBM1579799.1 cytochrome P450 [Sulfitobacter mediterraneus]